MGLFLLHQRFHWRPVGRRRWVAKVYGVSFESATDKCIVSCTAELPSLTLTVGEPRHSWEPIAVAARGHRRAVLVE